MMKNKFRGFFSLLTLGLVLGACTSAPVAKQSALNDNEGRLARQASYRIAVDRYIAQYLMNVPRLLANEMKTAVSKLSGEAQTAARNAVLAEAKSVSGRQILSLDDLINLDNEEALKLSNKILENPANFKFALGTFTADNPWVKEVTRLSQPGASVNARDIVRGTQPATGAELTDAETALVNSVLFEKGALTQTEQVRSLTTRLLTINRERQVINGTLFLEAHACNRMNGQLQLEAVENLALLGEMENAALNETKGKAQCAVSRSVGTALVKWYSKALGGAEATSEALAMKASQRAIDLCSQCNIACPIVPVAQQIQANNGALPSCQ